MGDMVSCQVRCQKTCQGCKSLATVCLYVPKPTLQCQDVAQHTSSRKDKHHMHHGYHITHTEIDRMHQKLKKAQSST